MTTPTHPDQRRIDNPNASEFRNLLADDDPFVFAPSESEVERATRIVEAYETAQREGAGAVAVDGEMIDEATNKMAQGVVARADAAGRL